MIVGILGWTLVGLIVGFVASKIINLRGDDPRLGFGVAVAGAIVAGIAYTVISGVAVAPWNPWSLLFAAIGGVGGVAIWHLVRSRYVDKSSYVRRSSY